MQDGSNPELPPTTNLRTSMSVKQRNHDATGNPKGRPRHQFGKSAKTDEQILDQVHADIEAFMNEQFAVLGEECER